MNCSQWLAEKFNNIEFQDTYKEMNELISCKKLLQIYEKNFRPLVRALIDSKRQLKKTKKKLEIAYSYLPQNVIQKIEKKGETL